MSGRARSNTLVFVAYVAVAFGYFGWRLILHPGRYILGTGSDPQIFIWAFAWWPHAVETWQNPFYSHAVYAPDGVNLAWATTVPGLAFAFAPLTLLFGPVVSYNVAALLVPALSAFTAFILCRHVAGSRWAGLVGGYLFGFSSYELAEELGHLQMTAVFLVPLVALALVRYVREEIDTRGLTWRLGVLLGLQLWISTEVLFTLTLALLVGIALTYANLKDARPRLRSLGRPIAGAYLIGALIAAPLVYYAATGFTGRSINFGPSFFDGDLLNFVIPTHLTALGGSYFGSISEHFRASDAEQGAYLGVPILAIVAWYVIRSWRSRTTRLLLVLLTATALVTLGTGVAVRGGIRLWLPWSLIARLPIFDNVLPVRVAMYSSLIAAIIVALWTASRAGWTAWLIPAIALATLMPAVWHADYRMRPERWAFFTDAEYKECIPRNENVAIFPFGFWGSSMLWQAETGFWFNMAEGYLFPDPPPANLANPTIRELTYTDQHPTMDQILSFVKAKKVDRIVAVGIYAYPNGNQMHRFGAVQNLGGVLVSPACGYPSLQTGIHPTPIHPPPPPPPRTRGGATRGNTRTHASRTKRLNPRLPARTTNAHTCSSDRYVRPPGGDRA